LIVLDGPSSVGKSTIVAALLQYPELDLQFVKRYTTRPPRSGDQEEANYIFTSMDHFREMERADAFIEVRHFEFGMSYGLPFRETKETLSAGPNALALISLGNAPAVRRHYPDCLTVLIVAPLATIEQRLRSRGIEEAKIRERLDNARTADTLRASYDYVSENKDGNLMATVEVLAEVLRKEVGLGHARRNRRL
jgi:guanylate kinase